MPTLWLYQYVVRMFNPPLRDKTSTMHQLIATVILITFIIAFCKAGAVDGSKERGR